VDMMLSRKKRKQNRPCALNRTNKGFRNKK